LLCKAANERNKLTRVFATSEGIRGFNIWRHTSLDLSKLIPATKLSDACANFGTSPKKVEGFSHDEVQEVYGKGELFKWMQEQKAKLSEYLTADVLSEASLFVILKDLIAQFTGQKIIGHKSLSTVGGIAWATMQARCSLPPASPSAERDQWIRGAITGGRVECYETLAEHFNEEVRLYDVCSLYPTAMYASEHLDRAFPERCRWGFYPTSGEIQTDKYVEGHCGVYDVTIHRQPEDYNVLPKRTEGEPLDWKFKGEYDTRCTAFDIELIRHYCGEDAVTVHKGVYYEHSSRELFRPYVAPFNAEKCRQDTLKAAKSPDYNPSFRSFVKLLLNSASGKLVERIHLDETTIARGKLQQYNAVKNMDPAVAPTHIILNNETTLVVGKKRLQDQYNPKKAKPSVLGVYVYAFSRGFLYQHMLKGHKAIYGDTDSVVLRKTDWEKMEEEFPYLIPNNRNKELGDLEAEGDYLWGCKTGANVELLPSGKNECGIGHDATTVFSIKPKMYAVFGWKNGRIIGKKMKAKGVNINRDIVADHDEETLKKLTFAELDAYYKGSTNRMSVPEVALDFYRRLGRGESVTVVCSQLVRRWRDQNNLFTLQQRYLVKVINRHDEPDGDDVAAAAAASEPDE
jgi:hypothetical protein